MDKLLLYAIVLIILVDMSMFFRPDLAIIDNERWRTDQAIKHFDKGDITGFMRLSDGIRDDRIYRQKGLIYLKKGLFETAREHFGEIDDKTLSNNLLAYSYMLEHNFSKAIGMLYGIEDNQAKVLLSIAYMGAGNITEARTLLQRIDPKELDKDTRNFYNSAGALFGISKSSNNQVDRTIQGIINH